MPRYPRYRNLDRTRRYYLRLRWIWTISLVFDNTVLLRKTVR
jgi:hypothetical protein